MPIYAFGVFGPPGSGKSSYCREIVALMRSMGRKVKLIDLDPANEVPCYASDVSIRDLINTDEVMKKEKLGFNGALLYCMNHLDNNKNWLMDKIKSYEDKSFVVMDLPGQVELFIHNNSLKNIFASFEQHGILMATAYLVDSFCCSDPGLYMSFLITTLMSMTHIELPRVNMLSKIDLLPKHEAELNFGLDFYTNVLDLDRLVACVNDGDPTGRYKKLTSKLATVIGNYDLVNFIPLSLSDKASLVHSLKMMDQAAGNYYSGVDVLGQAVKVDTENEVEKLTAMLNEKYVINPQEFLPATVSGIECIIRENKNPGPFPVWVDPPVKPVDKNSTLLAGPSTVDENTNT